MDLGLKDKVAVVAAATTGLGLATAMQLVEEGAKVIICGRSVERLEKAINQIRSKSSSDDSVLGLQADVTYKEQSQKLIKESIAKFGKLDILITNASGPPSGTFTSTDLEQWEKTFKLTLMSATYLIYEALPYLQKSDSASILTITSITVKQPIPDLLLSNVFRPAVIGLTKSLSQELGPANIRVNSILPGWTETDRSKQLLAYRAENSHSSVDEVRAQLNQTIPLRRMAQPQEFARVATFLVSPAASYINGVMLHVDGGSYSGLL